MSNIYPHFSLITHVRRRHRHSPKPSVPSPSFPYAPPAARTLPNYPKRNSYALSYLDSRLRWWAQQQQQERARQRPTDEDLLPPPRSLFVPSLSSPPLCSVLDRPAFSPVIVTSTSLFLGTSQGLNISFDLTDDPADRADPRPDGDANRGGADADRADVCMEADVDPRILESGPSARESGGSAAPLAAYPTSLELKAGADDDATQAVPSGKGHRLGPRACAVTPAAANAHLGVGCAERDWPQDAAPTSEPALLDRAPEVTISGVRGWTRKIKASVKTLVTKA